MDLDAHLPLSPREFHILLAVAAGPANGYRIGQLVEENSRGKVRLSPATQFTNVHRLVSRGLVREVTRGVKDLADGRGQRFWALTPLGERVLHAEGRRLALDARLVRDLVPGTGK